MSSRTFNLTGFSLPVAMAYSTAPAAPAQAVGISTSADAARALVMRTVMQAVLDVLEQQGRAGPPTRCCNLRHFESAQCHHQLPTIGMQRRGS
ncbi:hypothetical protein KIN20_021364 [Parelaphostrongylus tenuis]|nr:hypothetical protein KIN20_021364 [Parelaphostrongylus tenuis]